MSLHSVRNRIVLPALGWSTKELTGPDGRPMRNLLRGGLASHFLPIPGGADGGYNAAADVVEQTIDGVNTNELWEAYQASVELRNSQRQPLIDFLTWSVTEPFEGVPLGSAGARFERATQYGVPRAHRTQGELQWLGYDFSWFDLANRYTWEFLADATAAQIDSNNQAALEADNTLVFEMVLWTLFNNTNRSTSIQNRPYTVYSFYNGTDGVTPPTYKTNTFTNTHTHYLSSGAASIDPGNAGTGTPGDLDDIITHLSHHGYGPDEGSEIIIMMNEAQGNVVRNWRSVANGGTSLYDFIPSQGTPSFLLPVTLRVAEGQTQPANTIRGMKVIGSYGPAIIVQENYIPTGYVVGFATGGQESVRNPIGFREHANPALRGLRLVKGRRDDYPLQEAYYQRGFGTGVRHRGAGVVMKITAGAYTVPTEYATMP